MDLTKWRIVNAGFNFQPFYHEAGKIIKEDESVKPDKKITLAKVDATVETELASRFNLQGYPTLKIFRNGVAYEYDGPRRDGQGILLTWILKKYNKTVSFKL